MGPGNLSLLQPLGLGVAFALFLVVSHIELIPLQKKSLDSTLLKSPPFEGPICFLLGAPWTPEGEPHCIEFAAPETASSLQPTFLLPIRAVALRARSWEGFGILETSAAHSPGPERLESKEFFVLFPHPFPSPSLPFHFYSLETPLPLLLNSKPTHLEERAYLAKVSLSLFHLQAAPSPSTFPFNLFCSRWPGPLSCAPASQYSRFLKMLITPGLLLVPRIFLFIKPPQTSP